ncbi:glucosylceramidase 4, partial [Brachionus plicatilis]
LLSLQKDYKDVFIKSSRDPEKKSPLLIFVHEISTKNRPYEFACTQRKQGYGQTPKKMTKVQLNKLKKAFDHKDNISQRKAAKKFDISQKMVSKLLKKLQITLRKTMKIPDRTETRIENRKKVARTMNPIPLSVMRGVLPFIKKQHSDGNCKFWPDLASSHYANTVINYLIDQNIKIVQKFENTANVPKVRPIEDFWSILKGKVY